MNAAVKANPVIVIVGSVMTIANAIIGVLLGFEIVHWSPAQVGLVVALLNAVLAPVTAIVSQGYTTPYDPNLNNTPDNVYSLAARNYELANENDRLKETGTERAAPKRPTRRRTSRKLPGDGT